MHHRPCTLQDRTPQDRRWAAGHRATELESAAAKLLLPGVVAA